MNPYLMATLCAGCLAVAFVLSGMEAGLFEVSRLRVRRLGRAGNHRAKRIQRFLDSPEDFLWTVLVGNTIANCIAVTIAFIFLQQHLVHPFGFWAAFAVCGVFFYAFFEYLPKTLFRLHPDSLCLAFSNPVRVVHLLLRPVVLFLHTGSELIQRIFTGPTQESPFGSREEIHFLMRESAQSLSADERVLIDQVLSLQRIPIRDILSPLNMVWRPNLDTPVSELVRRAGNSLDATLPIWSSDSGSVTRVVGVVDVRNVLYLAESETNRPASDFLEPAMFQNGETGVGSVFQLLQRTGRRHAIILDKDNREIGIVTVEEILGLVFGKLRH